MNWHKGFKPYYNWNTFNTEIQGLYADLQIQVLNLIITGIPSIPEDLDKLNQNEMVLNLIITGMPSIQLMVKSTVLIY